MASGNAKIQTENPKNRQPSESNRKLTANQQRTKKPSNVHLASPAGHGHGGGRRLRGADVGAASLGPAESQDGPRGTPEATIPSRGDSWWLPAVPGSLAFWFIRAR